MGLFRYKRYVHPVRTAKRSAKRAVTPKPIRKVRRAVVQVRHPGSTLEGAAKAELSRALSGRGKQKGRKRRASGATSRKPRPAASEATSRKPRPAASAETSRFAIRVIPRPRQTARPKAPPERWFGYRASLYPSALVALPTLGAVITRPRPSSILDNVFVFAVLIGLVLACVIIVRWWLRRRDWVRAHRVATTESLEMYATARPDDLLAWLRTRAADFGMASEQVGDEVVVHCGGGGSRSWPKASMSFAAQPIPSGSKLVVSVDSASEHQAIVEDVLSVLGDRVSPNTPPAANGPEAGGSGDIPGDDPSEAGTRAETSPGTGVDVIEIIARLAELRDAGHLTEAEFAAKKADLLDRI
jgi:Short C-terminal domain